MPEVTPIPKGSEAGAPRCEDSGDLKRNCKCSRCLGARNRRKGLRKQRDARKAAEKILDQRAGRYASQTGNEENWRLRLRFEHKATKQSGAVVTFYRNCREQCDAATSVGDIRPFVAIASQNGTSKRVWVISDEDVVAFAEQLLGLG